MKLVRTILLGVTLVVLGATGGMSAPGDVRMERDGSAEQAYPPATFPHWVHAIRYRCYACHPAVFKMTTFETVTGTLKQDREPFKSPNGEEGEAVPVEEEAQAAETGEARQQRMHGREACGLCHDSKKAFNVEFRTCARCHVP